MFDRLEFSVQLVGKADPEEELKMLEKVVPRRSVETSGSSVTSRMPFMEPLAYSSMAARIDSTVASLFKMAVKSTTETVGVGTRKAMPPNLP